MQVTERDGWSEEDGKDETVRGRRGVEVASHYTHTLCAHNHIRAMQALPL